MSAGISKAVAIISMALSWWWEQCKDYDHTKATLILSLLLVAVTWLWRRKSGHGKVLLPPGPWGLPLVGSLPFLDPHLNLHRYYAQLALRYGPIFKVQLGRKLCVVISSPEAAKEVLREQDVNFSDRAVSATASACTYGAVDITFSPYGDYWRMVRKVCVRELLGRGNLKALYGLRRKEVRDMVGIIYSKRGNLIDIAEHVHYAMINIMIRMMWGDTLDDEERRQVTPKFQEHVQEILNLLGEPNISDFFPMISKFDIQGKARRTKQITDECDKILETVIDRRSGAESLENKESTDFLQAMLQLINQGDQKAPFKRMHLKSLLLDMLLAGTDTTATMVEWAMAELLNKPEILKKALDELDQVVGGNNMVEESHLTKLPFLDAITKETLRLHPLAPLPHCARESRVVGGYLIPRGATIVVNAWAIHTDPTSWNDPLEFKPERFLGWDDLDFNGNDFRYIPFGSGRRNCVGIPLTEKLLPYFLASLLHSFNWKLPDGTDVDLSEQYGGATKKKLPLVAIPTPKLSDASLY